MTSTYKTESQQSRFKQLWSKLFFPLEKEKNCSSEGGRGLPPPLTKEKNFFPFLDKLGQSKHKIKSLTFTLDIFHTFFLLFLLLL